MIQQLFSFVCNDKQSCFDANCNLYIISSQQTFQARIIYEDFISILSPKEVSLDSRVREIVNTNMSRPSSATFDEAQNQIYTLMQRDSYPRLDLCLFARKKEHRRKRREGNEGKEIRTENTGDAPYPSNYSTHLACFLADLRLYYD